MLSVVQCKGIGGDSGVRHLIQICNLATGSKVVSWTGALNSQVSGSDRPANCRLRNHCVVRIYPQVASCMHCSTSEELEVGSVVRSRGCSACCARRVYWNVNYFGVIRAILPVFTMCS